MHFNYWFLEQLLDKFEVELKTDKKIRLSRFFQIINITKNQTVFTSNVDYACVSLVSFKPVRMPEIYKNSYEVTCDV